MDQLDLYLKLFLGTRSSPMDFQSSSLSVVGRFTSPTLELQPFILSRIWADIKSGVVNVSDLVKAIKMKIDSVGTGNGRVARMVLLLLRACMNHEEGVKEVASEAVPEVVLAKLIENYQLDNETQAQAITWLIECGANEGFNCFPVFRHTYEKLKRMTSKVRIVEIANSESNGGSDVTVPYNHGFLGNIRNVQVSQVNEGITFYHDCWEPHIDKWFPIESSSQMGQDHIPEWVYQMTSKPDKYRTEMCIYGITCSRSHCLFAHFEDELREKDYHPKYKTKHCRNIGFNLPCPYHEKGRCSFLHENPGDYQRLPMVKKNH